MESEPSKQNRSEFNPRKKSVERKEPKKSDQEFLFKPLSDGLGINHFSDGLPYASISHQGQQRTMPPKPAWTGPKQGHFELPLPRPPMKAKQEIPMETLNEQTPSLAPRYKRVLAFGVDFSVVVFIFGIAIYSGLIFSSSSMQPGFMQVVASGFQWRSQLGMTLIMFFGVLYLGYFLFQELAWRTTLGKSVFKIHLKTDTLRLIWRTVLFPMIGIPGLPLIFFKPRWFGIT